MLRIDRYFRPQSVDEALDLLAEQNSQLHILAGGTDLLMQLKAKDQHADILDLGMLSELKQIRKAGDSIVVGTTATFTEIENSPLVKQHCPVLVKAASNVGSPQIRNVGTIGGNIANDSPAADTVTSIVAHGGSLELLSKGVNEPGRIHISEYFQEIKENKRRDELITAVVLPIMEDFQWGFSKLGRRKALAIARLSSAVGVKISDEGSITDAIVVLGAVSLNPFRSKMIENAVIGSNIKDGVTDGILKAASQEVEQRIGGRASMPYKRLGVRGPVSEAYHEAIGRIGGE
jgi:CO/xanthine dehydrogenase FAD-binding subunit